MWEKAGHELRDPSDWEHVAEAQEYAHRPPDFRLLLEEALPLLNHVASTDPLRAEAARRLIIRYHMAMSGEALRSSRVVS